MRGPAILIALVFAACTAPATPDVAGQPEWRYAHTGPEITTSSGLVVSDAALASEAGAFVLAAGGNAVDAAVATAFALAVVLPQAGNLGGGGFAVLRFEGRDYAFDFREVAPAAATRDMYAEAPNDARYGLRAAGVPGTVKGLFELHRRLGRRPWKSLLEPALRLARDGFVVDGSLARSLDKHAERLARDPTSAALFLSGGSPPREGETWRAPDLAATLQRIAEQGAAGFYTGETADAIVAAMQAGGGLVTHADLAAYRVRLRPPISFDYRGYTVVSMPLPSSGGLTLAMLAGLLREEDLGALGWHSPAHLHLLAEAGRRAFAARNAHLGDSDFIDNPSAMLTTEAWLGQQRRTISRERATPSSEIGVSGGDDSGGTNTTHLSVVDVDGNAVALTTTLNSSYGCGVSIPGAGFLMNNEMDDFTTRPGQPNSFGLVQSEANAIAPGKRMLSSMCPTLVLDPDGSMVLVTGAAGGPKIISAVFQVLSNFIDFGMDPIEAVAAPRMHHQHLPDRIAYERDGFHDATLAALSALGHALHPEDKLAVAPTIGRRGEVWVAAPDRRRTDSHASAEESAARP